MPVIKCKRLNTERPYIYNLQFIDREKRRSHITCVEGYTFTIVYHNGQVMERTGIIQRIEVNEDRFHHSYIILDVNNDAIYGALKIYFDQIICIKSSQVNDAYYIAVMHGFRGTLADWFRKMRGAKGYSAYEIAVQNGFVGDEEAWLDSLVNNTKLDDLRADMEQKDEDLSNDISIINADIEEIRNSLKGKTIEYEEGMELPSDGSIFAISVTTEQLANVPVTPGCFVIVPETEDIYVDTIAGRIKLQTKKDIDAAIEEALGIKEV